MCSTLLFFNPLYVYVIDLRHLIVTHLHDVRGQPKTRNDFPKGMRAAQGWDTHARTLKSGESGWGLCYAPPKDSSSNMAQPPPVILAQ